VRWWRRFHKADAEKANVYFAMAFFGGRGGAEHSRAFQRRKTAPVELISRIADAGLISPRPAAGQLD